MFRLILLALLVYLVVRAVSRLIVAMQNSEGGGRGTFPPNRGNRYGGGSGSNGRATRDEHHEDIEDARWKDL